MSTMAYSSENEMDAPPRPMPGEVGNLAAAWWLTIGFSLLLLLAVLPMGPRPLAGADGIQSAGWWTYIPLALVLVGFGAYVGARMRTGTPGTLQLCKIGFIALVALDVLAFTMVLVLAAGSRPADGAGASPGLLGPRDSNLAMVSSISLLGMVVLLPVVFAILGFSVAASYEVTEYFRPPQEETVSYTAEESAGGAWEGAGVGDREDTGAIGLAGREAVLEPPVDVSSDAFDAALAQEMPESAPTVSEEHAFPAADVEGSAIREALVDASGEIAEGEEVPEVVAESEPDIDFTSELPAAEEASDVKLSPETAPRGPHAGREGSTPDIMDHVLADPSVGVTDSFIVKGPPKMTFSQMDIPPEEPEEGTAIEPAQTWNFTEENPDDKDKDKNKKDKPPKS